MSISQSGSTAVGLLVTAQTAITADATGFGAGFTTPPSPSVVMLSTTQEAQIHGDVTAVASGAGTDSVSITAGQQLYIDGIVNAAGKVTLAGGSDFSGVSVWIVGDYDIDSGGNILPDAHGDETFVSGGQIETASGGQISISGTQDVEVDGIVGVTTNPNNVLTASTSAITVTSTRDR